MVDVAMVATILAVFIVAGMLVRPLDRLVAHSADNSGTDGDERPSELPEPDRSR